MPISKLFKSIYQIYSKNEKNSEVLEAFKMFDTDGDGKVTLVNILTHNRHSYNIFKYFLSKDETLILSIGFNK